MYHPRTRIWILTTLLVLMTGTLAVAAEPRDTSPQERRSRLVLCRVSENPKKHIKDLQPMVDYAASQMADVGITQGQVLLARDNRQLINYLRQGRVDWVTETPFSAALFTAKGETEIMLLRMKKGVSHYHTVFFARKDSGIKKLEDLKNRKIALEDSGSTSGFFMPVSMMLQGGLSVTELINPRESVPAGMTAFVFASEEMNISNMVYRRLTDAGAMSNLDWQESDRVQNKMKEELEIFLESKEMPRSLELVRAGLDTSISNRLKQVLLQAHENAAGQAALEKYKGTSQFLELNAEDRRQMENIGKLAVLIEQELL